MPREFSGVNKIYSLDEILRETSANRILLVTGKNSYNSSGAKARLGDILKDRQVKIFNDFSSSPQFKELQRGYESLREYNPELIIGIGGGSVLDSAKFIKAKYFENLQARIPLVAIPTTAGTGSESTYFIVFYDGKEKQSAGKSDLTLPDYIILDPTLTLSTPRNIAASAGLDAFSQAVESYWSVHSTEESKEMSSEAIKLLLKNLETYVLTPDISLATNTLKAANLAGKAINIAKTTACHAISYPLTSYFGIPHGHAVGLTLGELLVYNSQINAGDCNDKRGVEYIKTTIHKLLRLLGVTTAEEAKQKIESLTRKLGLDSRLGQLGIRQEDLEFLVSKINNPERLRNNPRLINVDDLRRVLKNIF